MGIESLKREDICIADSLCCTAETKTTLYINYTPIKINFKKRKKIRHVLICTLQFLTDKGQQLIECEGWDTRGAGH